MTATAFLHCGLHKTGTTAVQTAFCEHRELLAAHGLLYPQTGVGESGHHNIAWEIAGDPRFDPNGVTLAHVLRQSRDFDGDIVLSSEDFESVLHCPDSLTPLVQGLRATGRDVCLVIYVRDRTAYAESLYLELLKHGYAESFRRFLCEIRSTGCLRFRAWTFQFNEARLTAGLAALPQARVVRRSYDEISVSNSVVADFLALIGRDPDILGEVAYLRTNEREPAARSLSLFCGNRLGRPLHAVEVASVDRLCAGTAPLRLMAGPRFRTSRDRALRAPGTARLERVCSSVTVHVVAGLPWLSRIAPRLVVIIERMMAAWWAGGRRSGHTNPT